MKSSLILTTAISTSTALLLAGSNIMADTTPPATQPGEVAYSPETATTSVIVFPFRLIGTNADGAWISQAIDEDLRAQVAASPSVSLIPAPAKRPATPADALNDGLQAGAKFVVYGTYQVSNGEVRITGSVISVVDGKIVEPLNATGQISDLFDIEDALTGQIAKVLPLESSTSDQAQAETYANEQAPQTYYYYPTEPDQYAYSYPAPVPDYDYYSPIWGGPIWGGVYLGGGCYNGFDHRFNHGGFPRGGFPRGGFPGGGFPRGGFPHGGGFPNMGGFPHGGGFPLAGGFPHGGFGGGFHGGFAGGGFHGGGGGHGR